MTKTDNYINNRIHNRKTQPSMLLKACKETQADECRNQYRLPLKKDSHTSQSGNCTLKNRKGQSDVA
ncbi:hypothetical protein [uncultured Methanobrevibacter sp.]|uniref:hypothetical protein n=1 Tax=uncultured Methanobrevibacter sp. TaxID=253161 RepID=UPI00262AEB6E|nr:hypothetical protein [uncultured Methanobrevibacter sp.]